MNERIKQLRNALGLTQQEFSDRLGTTRSNIAGYETAKRSPSNAAISLICEKFDVNEEWLRNGTGEMFKEHPLEDEIGYYVEDLLDYDDNPLYDLIIDMMKTYQGLDEKSKEVVKDFFGKLQSSRKEKKED